MLLMSLVNEDIATVLEQYKRGPKSIWDYLREEYDKVTPELRQLAKEKLTSFKVNEKLSVRDIKLEFLSILRECIHQKYKVIKKDEVMTLFAGMARTKYGLVKRLYYGYKEAPGIECIWPKMGVNELDDKKEHAVRDDDALVAEAHYSKWTARQNAANRNEGGRIDDQKGRHAGRENFNTGREHKWRRWW